MRLAILVSAAFLIVSCKSKDKAPDAAAPAAPAAPAAGAKTDAKAAVKDAAKDAKSAANPAKIECKLQKEVRELEVRGKDKGCEAAYTKGGQENVVGSSQNGTAHCEGIVNRIKEKLVAAGFTCN